MSAAPDPYYHDETARHRVTHRHLLELQPVEAQPEIPQGRLF